MALLNHISLDLIHQSNEVEVSQECAIQTTFIACFQPTNNFWVFHLTAFVGGYVQDPLPPRGL